MDMKIKKDLHFSNTVIDKKQLKHIIVWAFRTYGIARAANMADRLKDLGFYYATKAGISLSLEDLRIPPVKKTLLKSTLDLIIETDYRYKRGEITAVERFQKVIDTWNNSSEMLKKEVVKYFKHTDPLNAIYMMAFSGARGNISQVRQLVGMRGLMSDPQGQIIDLPISSNFREGLTVTDYFISSYGARKGLVDIALRTADSGYLTRRLVDVAQDVIVREVDCRTFQGIILEDVVDNHKILISLEQSLIGRLLAEDVWHPVTNKLIATMNQDVDDVLAKEIVASGITKVLVRSPITCNASSSVCQKCYGWNLAHGRLVDLGEAIGIIAAQSIGEPGTQLTMRTFHTGGVFTGEFADKIYAPFDAVITHPDKSLLMLTRTSHGDRAYLIKKDCHILLSSLNKTQSAKIALSQGSLLLTDDLTRVFKSQLIAEYPLKSRLATEKAQKVIVADISGKIAFTSLVTEEADGRRYIAKTAQSGGIAWILSGQVYTAPDNASIMVKTGDIIYQDTILSVEEILSNHSGYAQILDSDDDKKNKEIFIVTASKTIANAVLKADHCSAINTYILETGSNDRFLMKIGQGDKIIGGQIIGELNSDVYKTRTGGIVKYLDLPVSKKKNSLHGEYYNILGAGYILWIAEETHEVNKDASLLLIKHGDFVNKGTEIMPSLFAQNTGIVEIVEKDNIVREVVIKPCTIYSVEHEMLFHQHLKKRGFLRPGEKIVEDVITDRLVYWEQLTVLDRCVLLVRPVIVYSIPNKSYDFVDTKDSFRSDLISLNVVRQINFKDGARVKSVEGVSLVTTYLTVDIASSLSHLVCSTHFMSLNYSLQEIRLKFTASERILIKSTRAILQGSQIVSRSRVLISDNAFVAKSQIIAQTELVSNVAGQVMDIQEGQLSSRRFLILTELDKKTYSINNESLPKVNAGDWIYQDQEIASGIYSLESGQVLSVTNKSIVLRIARPYLISHRSILHVDHDSLVQRGENIATLIFNRAKTGDIVQGLPRIEEVLEARKKVDSNFNPHLLLEDKFRFYLDLGLSLYDATRISVQEVQFLLIKEVQLVYQSQGVDISDKHIEVIVRQMTAKVKIEKGGSTNHLPGEIVDLQKIEAINKTLAAVNQPIATYHPILLGITKASLNTESFISAASFQETTKVLTEAAISGKLDWLRGLKENVIIGRLIPAGTGFNAYSSNVNTQSFQDSGFSASADKTMDTSFEDIILDDREARNLIEWG